MTTIPHLIDFATPCEAAICLHEAGHATAALVVGLAPALIEIIEDDPASRGRARASIPIASQENRRIIASAALAVEFHLYEAGRLVDASGAQIDEKTFIQLALAENAAADKISFFDEDRAAGGVWPKADDLAFFGDARRLSKVLPLALVHDLAEALMNERRLECPRIIEIGARHLPGLAEDWSCP